MTIFRFALVRALRNPLNLLLIFVLPLGAAFLPSAEGWTMPIGFQMYGAILLFASFLMLRSVVEDGASGVYERICAAPVTHLRYLGQTLLAYALVLVAMNAAVVPLGILLHGARLLSPLLLFVAYSTFSLTSLSLCLAGGALLRSRETAYQSFSIVLMVLAMVGGLFWPLEIMPPAMRRIALVTPCYWLVEATEALRAGGRPGQYVLSLLVMVLFAIAFLIVGSRRRMA